MAKKNGGEVAVKEVTETSLMTSDMASMLSEDAGTGFEGVTSKDVAIPYYGVLQALSPQVKRGPTHVEGAREGDIINTVTQEIIPGETGIFVIPCAFVKMWVEWTPREKGGGFVKQHRSDEILKNCKPNPTNGRPQTPDGTDIVDTAYHYILRVKEDESFERALISMTSTQLKKSRRWMAQMMNLQIRVGEKMINPPPYSHMYRLTAIHEQKDEFSWFGWQINTPPIILENMDLYKTAKKFGHDVLAGLVETAPPPAEGLEVDVPVQASEKAKQSF